MDINWDEVQKDLESGFLYKKEILEKYNFSIKRINTAVKKGKLNKEKWKIKKQKHSDETKDKISKIRKEWLSNNPDKHPWKSMGKFKSKPCEKFKEFLRENNIIFTEEVNISKERNYSVDILIEEYSTIVEINGNQHYDLDGNLSSYYLERHNYIESLGWNVFEIHYKSVYNLETCNYILNNIKDGNRIDLKIFKNIKKVNLCNICKKECRGKICQKCYTLEQRRVIRPDSITLNEEVDKLGYTGVARKYGVSDNAIRKWIKSYEKYNS